MNYSEWLLIKLDVNNSHSHYDRTKQHNEKGLIVSKSPSISKISELSQAKAKENFVVFCKQVVSKEEKIYIVNKSKKRFMTLDYLNRYSETTTSILDVPAQSFKDNFSEFSFLIRINLNFRISLRGTDKVVYARRHQKYHFPLDYILKIWEDSVVEMGVRDLVKDSTMKKYDVEILEKIDSIAKGIARMAIGHKPFSEGMISD